MHDFRCVCNLVWRDNVEGLEGIAYGGLVYV